ncbi:HAMP domain-containing sensor histidine kinase [Ideonella sp.]|uniref:sensor histidine kinase n=1 Tax=Ideonella sp. TaxID=1929293 RepID=UPI003BB7E8FF
MKSLYLRIWLTVLAALALFALTSGLLVQRHLEAERSRAEAALAERMAGWGELIQNSLPDRTAPVEAQAEALREWSSRLRVPLALTDHKGQVIAESESYAWLLADGRRKPVVIQLDDGRQLRMMRPLLRGFQGGPPEQAGERGRPPELAPPPKGLSPPSPPRVGREGPGLGAADRERGPFPGEPGFRPLGFLPDWPAGVGILVLVALLFVAVAAGAYPVVRGLTRRLESLKQGVEAFGGGALNHRVDETGRDEVAALAASFNRAAQRIETLVQANQSLLANASHELRSPLARLKMAVAMMGDSPPAAQAKLQREINTNIAELDALVEEVLLSSRLEAGAPVELQDPVDLLGLAVEEASRVDAQVDGTALMVAGSDRLLRRAVRNLLENARRYGGDEVALKLVHDDEADAIELQVSDRGPGVPEAERERIFEPFYRLPGHAEREGGVGLGLALVRQIARRHGGDVRCHAHDGGGSVFVISLPASRLLSDEA